MAGRIEDYGLIGDTQTAALVGKDGSIDWLCFPRFDSGACFAALLGKAEHGRWIIQPQGRVTARSRRYWPNSLILESRVRTADGEVRIIDFMPPRETKPDVVRIVEGLSGEVAMRTELIIRFDYGRHVPWVRRFDHSLRAIAGPDALILRTPVETLGRAMTTQGTFNVAAGQRVPFVLTWFPSNEDVPRPVHPEHALDDTVRFWDEWTAGLTGVTGPWSKEMTRSLITLKALTYAPTGGIVAAPTTSLPEEIGGVRNWDYRYCWVRDATLTLDCLLEAGALDEARAWRRWLMRAAAGSPDQLQIMYGTAGERSLNEYEVGWLPGYRRSKPVRIGNAASEQFQLDVYGELMDAQERARRHGIPEEPESWALQKALVGFVEKHWSDPDNGIWEVRGPRRHFVHSRVMAWVALDRAVRACEEYNVRGPVERWKKVRDTIHREVCERGFNKRRGAFTQYYGSTALDASVLMIPLVGFLPPTDERMISTVEAIQRELVVDGFVQRYQTNRNVDGVQGNEGAFLPCSFWLIDNLALMGRVDEARWMFENLIGLCNDLGLYSEEYDPAKKRLVGNFPQAFTHVGLINSARNLTQLLAVSPRQGRDEAAARGAVTPD